MIYQWSRFFSVHWLRVILQYIPGEISETYKIICTYDHYFCGNPGPMIFFTLHPNQNSWISNIWKLKGNIHTTNIILSRCFCLCPWKEKIFIFFIKLIELNQIFLCIISVRRLIWTCTMLPRVFGLIILIYLLVKLLRNYL